MRPETSDVMRTTRDYIVSRKLTGSYYFLSAHQKSVAEVVERAVKQAYPLKAAEAIPGLLGELMTQAAAIPKIDIYDYMRANQVQRFFAKHGTVDVPVSIGGTRLRLQMLGSDLISITQAKNEIGTGDKPSITLIVDPDAPSYWSKITRKGRAYLSSKLGYGKIRDAFLLALDAIDRANGNVELLYKAVGERGHCAVCGRDLTDPLSKARGIGPECIKTFGSVYTAIKLAKERDAAMRKNPRRLWRR